ncbi:MAG: uracil-DNA glycosylase, partial [Actinobacteria bacterium]|nr:uracil-DNA glycosylase [Actinomycetota bacterium]
MEAAAAATELAHPLSVLHAEVAACTRCALAKSRTQVVFGAGSPDADLMFVGEAPGFHEDKQGVPFVGAAGQLLGKLLAGIGLRREDVYIANVLKCRPPGNRKPEPAEVSNCREYLVRQLETIKPRSICLLGASAVQGLLGTTESIGRLR